MRCRIAVLGILLALSASRVSATEITLLRAYRTNGVMKVEFVPSCPANCPGSGQCCWHYGGIGAKWDGGASGGIVDQVSGNCGETNVGRVVSTQPSGDGPHSLSISAGVFDSVPLFCSDGYLTRNEQSNPINVWFPSDSSMPDWSDGLPDDATDTVGCPVEVATGRMYHEMTDMVIDGPLPIVFKRRYTSTSSDSGALGHGWQHTYMVRLTELSNSVRHTFINEQMRKVAFTCRTFSSGSCTEWVENPFYHMTLSHDSLWHVREKHGKTYDFDGSGNLVAIHDRNLNATTLTYTSGNLTAISDNRGRNITLSYGSGGILQSISAGSRTITYTISGSNDLTKVQYPDNPDIDGTNDSFVTYEYDSHKMRFAKDADGKTIEEHRYTGSKVNHTESEGGKRAYDIQYDASGDGTVWTTTKVTDALDNETTYHVFIPLRVVEDRTGAAGCSSCGGGISEHTGHDWNLNLVDITDGRGIKTHMDYDEHGNVLTRTEDYNPNNSTQGRKTTYDYDSTFNFPETVSVPSVGSCSNVNKVITNTYDNYGNITQQLTEGCGDGTATLSVSTSYTYDTTDHGRLLTVTGPRSDVTTYEYYGDSDGTINRRGRIKKITDAAGLETTVGGYDAFGNVESVIDANNVETTATYDGRNQMIESRVKVGTTNSSADFITELHYDAVGRLGKVRLPNCVTAGSSCTATWQYGYEPGVGWLKQVQDALGNKIINTYDSMGNRRRVHTVQTGDADGTAKAFVNFAYDSYNRLQYTYYDNDIVPESSGSVFAKYSYDGNGNVLSQRDPEGHVASYAYDNFNRLTSETQASVSGTPTTRYFYDGQDNLRCMLDPNTSSSVTNCSTSLSPVVGTTFRHDDLGRTYQEISPDSGTKTHVHDAAGNLTSTTNSRGITISRTYDAVNRLLSAAHSGASLDAIEYDYSYDSTSESVQYGRGRRTGMSDPSGTTQYSYDSRGNLVTETKTIGFYTFTTQYEFDKTGNHFATLYPSPDSEIRQGMSSFAYDYADRVSEIGTVVNGNLTSVLHDIEYKPFGPMTVRMFGSVSLMDSRDYDSRYQLGTWTLGSLINYTHTFDLDGNLTHRKINSAEDRIFGYDGAHRLVLAQAPQFWVGGTACTGASTYSYDKNGNRLCKNESGTTPTTYSYPSGNRLATSSDPDSTFDYDDDGNTISDGTGTGHHSYQYNAADRLISVDAESSAGPTATCTYDGLGRRVIKTTDSLSWNNTWYFYGPNGELLTEMVPAQGIGSDYIYSEGSPVARIDWTGLPGFDPEIFGSNASSNQGPIDIDPPTDSLYFYHDDHLGTPIAMTDTTGQLKWRAEYRPFGDLYQPLTLHTIENNLRFAGQYADEETGLYQNWYREYRPTIARYSSSDPIGVLGGANPYSYAGENPMHWIDPWGLMMVDPNSKIGRRLARDNPGPYPKSGTTLEQAWWIVLEIGFTSEVVPTVVPLNAGVTGGQAGTAGARTLLRAAMIEDGVVPLAGEETHHIVAFGAEAADEGRQVLARCGVGINESANGVNLPGMKGALNPLSKMLHRGAGIHSGPYYVAVNNLLAGAATREEAITILRTIASMLQQGVRFW
jgi:RHS repeat-associated protein